jgi:hypothetical protein
MLRNELVGDAISLEPPESAEDPKDLGRDALEARLAQLGLEVCSCWVTEADFVILARREIQSRTHRSSVAACKPMHLEKQPLIAGSDSESTVGEMVAGLRPPLPRNLSASSIVLSELLPRIAASCPILVPAVTTLFRSEKACSQSPEFLASTASVSRRTLDRHLRRAGIRSTRLLFASARTALAFSKLVAPSIDSVTLRHLGRELGCASFRPIQKQCVALTGLTLTELAAHASTEEFAKVVLRGLLGS